MKSSLQKKRIHEVNQAGARKRTPHFLVKFGAGEAGNRVAFSFRRAVGNAVVRNRFKRRIRSLVAGLPIVGGGCDFLFVAIQSLSRITDEAWVRERDMLRGICEKATQSIVTRPS